MSNRKTPMTSVNSWDELRDALKDQGLAIIDKFKRKDFEDVANGLSCFTSLNQAKGSCDYFSCQVSRPKCIMLSFPLKLKMA